MMKEYEKLSGIENPSSILVIHHSFDKGEFGDFSNPYRYSWIWVQLDQGSLPPTLKITV
jgi:hypothetical protein